MEFDGRCYNAAIMRVVKGGGEGSLYIYIYYTMSN